MPVNPPLPSPAARARVVGLVLLAAAGSVFGEASAQPSPPGAAPALQAQVQAQPYRIGDWAGFQPLAVTNLDILILGEAGETVAGDLDLSRPLLTVAVSASPSPVVGARGAFALRALEFVAFASDIRAESARTVRPGNSGWHELVGQGRSLSGGEVVVFQSIGFGPPGHPYLRVVGVAPAGMREAALPRFRRVARSITLRGGGDGRGP